MGPYSYENTIVAFETKVKKSNRDHPGRISRSGTSKINETSRKSKNTRDKFKSYNKRYNVPYISSGSVPKKLTTGKCIEYPPFFQYKDDLFGDLPEKLRQKIREEQMAYQE